MSAAKPSRREGLRYFVETGRLRQAVEGKLTADEADLLVDIVIRYCEPRRPSRWKRMVAERAKAGVRP